MSEYSPPNWIEPLSIYNPINFRQTAQSTNGGGGGGSGYLKYPVAQGPQTMKDTLINGSFSVSASEPVNMGGNIVQNAGTPVNPTDLATKAYVDLNAGTQNLQSVLTAGNTTGNFHISHADNYGDIYNGAGTDSWVVGCDPIQFSSTATNDLYLASNATDNFVRFGSYSGSTFTENARIGDLGTGEKRAIFAGTLSAVCIEDATGSKGTSGQVLTAGSGSSLVWGAGGGGAGTLDATLALGNSATGTYANINLTDTATGGQANPIMSLTNTNATTGGVFIDLYKNRTGATNDVVGAIHMSGKDASGNKVQFGGIQSVITSAGGAGGVDGALDFYSCVNGGSSLVWRLNGADNENNSFRPLDMNGNNITTSSSNMLITSASSTGTGTMSITGKGNTNITSNTGSIALTATSQNIALTASTYQHLITTQSTFTGTELHYGKITTANSTQVYQPFYQPLLTSTPNTFPIGEISQEGQQIMLINSKGDGNNELTIIPTPNFTITIFEYITSLSSYVAGGYNHIQARPEIRCGTSLNDILADITSGAFTYIELPATANPNGYISCMCYDPTLFPTTIAVGGYFSATPSDPYNPSGSYSSYVSNFLCINISTTNITPLNMEDAGGFPYTNQYGPNGVVNTISAYNGTYFGGTGNAFILGGIFTALNSNGGTGLPAGYSAMYIPVGGFTPLNLRWIVLFEANNNINTIIVYDANVLVGGDFTAINVGGASGGTQYLSWCNNLNSGSFLPVGSGATPFTPPSTCSAGSKAIINPSGANEGFVAFRATGSPTTYPVYNCNIADLTQEPVLYKDDFPAEITGFGVDTDASPMKLNFIVGYDTTIIPPINNFVWDYTTPQYLDLNGTIGIQNVSFETTASPNLPYFCITGSKSFNTPYQISFFNEIGGGSVVINTTTALPFVDANQTTLKWNKITLGVRNNFAMGTIVGFGTDDVRILIYSQNGATFSN